ncbi:hypothetical protein [Virgisporangium aurantiacum]|uniref:Uncharacterized protein n=1 Tax=Virgisporangium aurantiacum TaxID=175570 RepID=A0A8J3ZJD9_9ACTN|nr:hypothetical protein [Virgisporangium aurantiacum]GIJ64964.1 hypothetical protein Vau01_124800 [Virgisporangium aurantiacum]
MLSEMLRLAAEPDVLAVTGEGIATKLRSFFAPIAAVVIGVYGLRYLRGEDRSLALFLGYLAIAAFVFAMIQWGYAILTALGELIADLFK